ncbi:MAG TPA: bifunctional phosphopantothenoylcysteine decarboxylase/phosphopantothenate--cysteine ligase CoaBC [Anaerolineales bacterium]|nr:bifunctional phosphopantothenoylcysteine decarboxylase/phosphopantothenate--cysteine ligase CoaBC [Anaerolineales bacterium]HNA55855.1 bifunctional phosphopantothenoylcysteine decarboxylase/phosphopantothenate--cysteine ligase CoaBC [Anaerolineales bacterium]HNB88211.1 bifunctional phosphopantothenoylcysteine decarboxylase/phosphopantothenate--cysteine ligase CoaBC [Anaerolineales bacterium]HNC91334.1 bifunctional phosphopantothenoylcysteine decarboxylase/phosphopantothenate--cysteine ligase 
MSILSDKHILLGVTGSIAGYKAADLASKLAQSGAKVDVLLTEAGEKFVTPLTFQSVTGRRAYTDKDLWGHEAHVLHVSFGKTADLLVIAPCTADTIAKLANGIADNLLTVTALAATCPLVIAPAMDGGMFNHPATQENLAKLKERGAIIIGPAEGHLASGLVGTGRMVEPVEILGQIRMVLGRRYGKLAGKKVVVTAGGTQEALDPVRVITNHSSGKQGYAIAQAALDSGADVCLVTAPTALTAPVGARVVKVNSAEEMLQAVLAESADALVMAAAAADFRPKHIAKDKMKKRDGIPQIELEAAPDILKTVSGTPVEKKRFRVMVGFAAESQNLLENADEKLKSKKLDFIVANDISANDAGFAVDTNRVTFLFANGARENLPLTSKMEVAEIIIEHISRLLE